MGSFAFDFTSRRFAWEATLVQTQTEISTPKRQGEGFAVSDQNPEMPEENGGVGCSRCHYLGSHAEGCVYTIMQHSGKGDKQVREEEDEGQVEEDDGVKLGERSLLQHILSLDSFVLPRESI